MYQVKKDDYKTKICKLKSIDLISVPHFIHFDKLEDYIKRCLRKIKKFEYI